MLFLCSLFFVDIARVGHVLIQQQEVMSATTLSLWHIRIHMVLSHFHSASALNSLCAWIWRPFSCFCGLTSASKTGAGLGSVSQSGALPLLEDMWVSPQHYLYWGHAGFTHSFTHWLKHPLTHLLTLQLPANISISRIKGMTKYVGGMGDFILWYICYIVQKYIF